MRLSDLATASYTDFFDTLGIGCFAPTTAMFKLQQRMADDEVPATLNVGRALPTVIAALMIYAAVLMIMSARFAAGSQTSTPTRANPLHSHDA